MSLCRSVSALCAGLAIGAALALSPNGAAAQASGCTLVTYTDPPRETLTCPDRLTITIEAGAAYSLQDRNRDGRPDAVRLDGKGVLVDVPPGRRGGFQVQTPHAVASVRGTVWAVDVTPAASSVFVQTGAVAVNGPQGAPVILRDGDGVDVAPGEAPLEVKRWGRERAANLLARFGR
jgi:ferric-dicitrate binding protein FerR (iron transport regulator)